MAVECRQVLPMANTSTENENAWNSITSTNNLNPHCEYDDNPVFDIAITRTFEFIKENLMFDTLQDELEQRNLLLKKDRDDYVCKDGGNHFRNERLVKLIIRKKKCREFIKLLQEMPCYKHIFEKIEEIQKKDGGLAPMDAMHAELPFIPTNDLLQNQFTFLYMELEPREIADRMFQAGVISISEHDDITDVNQKYKRLRELLETLERKNLYEPFWYTLQSLKYTAVLDTLQTERTLKNKLCK